MTIIADKVIIYQISNPPVAILVMKYLLTQEKRSGRHMSKSSHSSSTNGQKIGNNVHMWTYLAISTYLIINRAVNQMTDSL
ncbi:hypothetical protein NKOR_06275 [Candidatus Nitrosopumilus koreensis AR1]|uniref:Uncharacterized protein n=1 Tax=Candidatus Nitrosopumilus koreensis AR1 TaxID=1229908 RepID=K0B9J5_9ARCH|nr:MULTISPECIES: hypothetical protein [Nitrosopumilus]AFS81136.1 hypothetical protein NKOR_06275 [Candidatus Nitrosopumilus koreensis AR1]